MALTYTVHIKTVDIDSNSRAFQLVSEFFKRGNNVQLVMTDEGVQWAKNHSGYLDQLNSEGITPYTYFADLLHEDVEILVLDTSADYHGIGRNDVVPNASLVSITELVSFMEETTIIPV